MLMQGQQWWIWTFGSRGGWGKRCVSSNAYGV